jgi:hypothetical protein
MSISFMNVQLDQMDNIKSEFYSILLKLIDQADLDMQRMANIIQMKICDINDKVSKNEQKKNKERKKENLC